MKTILEFNDTEKDTLRLKRVQQAEDMFYCLYQFSEEVMRPLYKHRYFKQLDLTDNEVEIIEHIREEFYRILESYKVELYD